MIFNIISIITLILSLFLGLYVYYSNKENKVNRVFVMMLLSAMAWIFSNLMSDISTNYNGILLWSKITIVGPIFIAYFFYELAHLLPIKKSYNSTERKILISVTALLLLFVPTEYNIISVSMMSSGVPAIEPGPLYAGFLLYFFITIILSFKKLFRSYSFFNQTQRLQVQFISIGLGLAIIFGSTTNLILPLMEVSNYVNLGPYFILFFIYFTGYAIIRLRLFNVKIVATQLLVFTLSVFVFVRTLFSDSVQEWILNGGLLLLVSIIGIFLIKSVFREIAQREHIEKLATDLQKANDRLTELDRQKSEFVSFATHQLRAPLTAMKGYASLILEGDVGAVSTEVKGAVSRIFDSAKTLANIVDDYLNITRIELGTMKYAFDTVDFKAMVEDVIAELKPNITASKATFTFEAQNHGTDYRVTADRDKLKQVIANLVDNSIKYTPSGSIRISLSRNISQNVIVFEVKDTGIGIAPEVLPHLFAKFSRAGNANKTNIKGTGLGLFVAKEIITAHHGQIYAESAGEGKGSRFVVELEPFFRG